MAKNNRSHFNPNGHQYQQEARRYYNRDRHDQRGSSTGGPDSSDFQLDTLDALARTSKETVKELRNLNRAFHDFCDGLTSVHALLTSAILAVGNEAEQDALREYLFDEDEDERPSGDSTKPAEPAADSRDTIKYALRADFNMNEIMHAAIDSTDEEGTTVRKVTEGIVAYLKRPTEPRSFTTKRFMDELNKAVRKRAESTADLTDFDAAVAVVKNALPEIVAAVSEITGVERTVVDRIAFAELLAARKMLVNSSCVASGDEAERMIRDLKGQVKPDANGVEVE